MIKFNFEDAFNRAFSSIITAIVIGACIIVYNGATTVQEKVDNSSNDLKALVSILQDEIINLKERDNSILKSISEVKGLVGEGITEYSEEVEGEVYSVPTQQNEVTTIVQESIPEKDFIEQKMWDAKN